MSTKKLNEALGIDNIDSFLSDLDIEEDVNKLNSIDTEVKKNIDKIDNEITEYNHNGVANIDISNIQSSLSEIKELIDISKQTIRHVYESIITVELVDSDAVHSLASLMESSHLAVKEYIDLYRDRLNFYDKVRMEQIKHQHKLEELDHKHKLDMEKLNSKQVQTIDVQNESTPFNQEDIIKQLDKLN